MSRLRLITFDLDNTLWPVAEVIERADRASSIWLQARFPELADRLTVPALHAVRDRLVLDQSHYWQNLTRLRLDMLKLALTGLGIGTHEADVAANAAFEVFYRERNRVTLFAGARELLETLGRHYVLGALSNGNANLERVGIRDLFQFHHNAESVGAAKPAAAMFEAALASAGVDASEALHVGDHPHEDVDGARHAGFDSVWANLLQLPRPDTLAGDVPQIRHFSELENLLEQRHE